MEPLHFHILSFTAKISMHAIHSTKKSKSILAINRQTTREKRQRKNILHLPLHLKSIIFAKKTVSMKPLVSIIMGSTSDLKVMEKAALFLDEMEIPFEMNALSAHRTPEAVEEFAKSAENRGLKVIIAGAGMAAHLPGVIAASTALPVIGVPISATLDGMDALLSIVQMPPGIPVATVGINNALNAAILAAQMLAFKEDVLREKLQTYKANLKRKIEKANTELKKLNYRFKTN